MLAELELKMSGDQFDRLNGQVYDAGTVMEELQETLGTLGQQLSFTLPSCAKVRGCGVLHVRETKAYVHSNGFHSDGYYGDGYYSDALIIMCSVLSWRV